MLRLMTADESITVRAMAERLARTESAVRTRLAEERLSLRKERGPVRTRTKLTVEDVRRIRKELESYTWGLMSRLGRRYGVTSQCIDEIKHGRNWKGV